MDREAMTVKEIAEYLHIGKNQSYEGGCPFAPPPGHTLGISHRRERIFMAKEEDIKKFWHVKELATYLGVSKSLIYSRIEKSEIPAKRIGARILIPASFVKSLTA